MTTPKLGGHVSAAGGLDKAIPRAVDLGAETFQIHATSPRQWKVKIPEEEKIKAFLAEVSHTEIASWYIHAPYLINLASPNPELVEKSISNLLGNFEIGQMIKAKGVVFHLGSSKGGDKKESIKREAEAIQSILDSVPGECQLLLENAAGGGDKVGANLEELSELFSLIDSDRVGICFDTAHAFEAGILEYTKEGVTKFFDEFDEKIGIENLKCIHLNDSLTEFDSQHDRHANIGEGYIGVEGLKIFAQDKRLHQADWVLEVPGFEGGGPDKENMDLMGKLFE